MNVDPTVSRHEIGAVTQLLYGTALVVAFSMIVKTDGSLAALVDTACLLNFWLLPTLWGRRLFSVSFCNWWWNISCCNPLESLVVVIVWSFSNRIKIIYWKNYFYISRRYFWEIIGFLRVWKLPVKFVIGQQQKLPNKTDNYLLKSPRSPGVTSHVYNVTIVTNETRVTCNGSQVSVLSSWITAVG